MSGGWWHCAGLCLLSLIPVEFGMVQEPACGLCLNEQLSLFSLEAWGGWNLDD